MKKLSLLVLAVLALIIYSCMQDMPSEPPVGELKITSPSASDRFAIGDTVTIQAEAIMSKFSKMDFFVDGVLKGSDSDAPFTCEWLTAGVAVGLHEIKTVSYGAKGEISQSVKVELINGIAPDLNINEPVDNSSYKIGSVINVLATATDSDGSVKSVAFYLNDSLIAFRTSTPYSVSWNTAGLPEGNYTIKAIAKDNMGVVSSEQITVNLYLKIPACLLESPINNSVYLYGQTVKIRAKAMENLKSISTVKFYIDNNLAHTSTVADSGSYYFYNWNTADQTMKNHQLKAEATDHNGRISTSNLIDIILNQVPTVDFINPQSNQVLSINSVVPVEINVLDVDGTINNVKIFIDGIEKATLTTFPYKYGWNTAGLTIGNHILKAVATDDFGAQSEKELTVYLNFVPTVNITSPANGSGHLIGSNILIAATATDNGKKPSVSKLKAKSIANVKFYINNVLKATDDSAPYEYNWNSSGLAVGSYTIKAVTTDDLGASAEQQILINLHTAPTVTITAPANNAPITIGTIVEIKASAADSKKGKSKAVSKVEFFVDGVLKGTDNSEPYSYIWNTAGTTIGTHAIKTVVTDDFNVTAENQITVNLNAAPEVSITAPANGSAHLIGSTILIKASATDSGKKLFSFINSAQARLPFKNRAVANVKFYINNVLKSTDDTAPYEYSWNSNGLSAGSYTLKAVVIDDLGASAEEVISVVLHTAPTVHITAPANNAVITIGSTVNVTATTADSKSKAVSRVDFYIDGELKGTDNASPFAYNWNTTGLSIGVHTVKAVVTDNYGASGEEQISVSLSLDSYITISGRILNFDNLAVSEVLLNGFSVNVTTDNNGYYSVSVPSGWSGTIKPQKNNYSFNPDSIQYNNVIINQMSQNYNASTLYARRAGGNSTAASSAQETGTSIALDNVGNQYITGLFKGTADFGSTSLTAQGSEDIYITKLNSSGDFVWAKRAGGTDWESYSTLAVDGSGNSYITGGFRGTANFGSINLTSQGGSTNIFIAKLDASGTFLWAKNITSPASFGTAVTTDNSGNVFVAGRFTGSALFGSTTLTSKGGYDIFIAKLNSNGVFLWANSAGGIGSDAVSDIVIDNSGNQYITGQFSESASFGSTELTAQSSTGNMFVAKLNPDGNFSWAKCANSSDGEHGMGIGIDGTGNVYVTGRINGTSTFGTINLVSNGSDILFTKLDNNGNFIWAKCAGGNSGSSEDGYSIAIDSDGNQYVTGMFAGTANFGTTTLTTLGSWDVFIAKLSNQGDFVWVKRAGGTGEDIGHSIAIDAYGNQYVTGGFYGTATFGSNTLTSTGQQDVFIAKFGNNANNKKHK